MNIIFERINEKKLFWLLVLLFALVTLIISWNSDDAYHAYIMAKNLVDGNGFVYHVGYRVSATTCPLFTLLTALVYAVLGSDSMYLAGIILGVACSTIAVYILVFKICKTIESAFLSVCILIGCYCFMSYTTAGLENSLLFLLSALFLYYFNRKELFEEKDLFILALLLSLLAMTRMDSVLLFIPTICIGYLFFSKVQFIKKVLIGLGGLFPFVLWEVFSIFYYGYPFPNTMYVKLNTGFPKTDYFSRGLNYLFFSSLVDIALFLVPLLFLILSIVWKNKRMQLVAGGVWIYLFYVVSIGGDFMVGRHLTVPFFVAFIGVLILFSKSKLVDWNRSLKKFLLLILSLELICGVFIRPVAKEYLFEIKRDPSVTGVADEKNAYYSSTGLIPYIQNLLKGKDTVEDYASECTDYCAKLREKNVRGDCVFFIRGIENYYAQEDGILYLTDPYGLMDPLLSHLPAVYEENWRIGHMVRQVPDGYRESVLTGTNQIVNQSLHEYYDKVLLIIQGDIWDSERLEVIVKMNLGEYDYLIDEYLDSI